jgi:RNA polymerase sigma-70 factor (ECF subfamily)
LKARDSSGEEYQHYLNSLCAQYWKPVYAYIRGKSASSNEDAKDLTQAFFTDLLDRPFLSNVDREKGRFRAFLLACVRNFIRDQRKREVARKRGGDRLHLSLDDEWPLDLSLDPVDYRTPEETYDREWRKVVLNQAIQLLQEECVEEDREIWFRVFESYDLRGHGEKSYADLASEFGMKPTDLNNALARARRRLRALVRQVIAASVAISEDVEEEIDHLFRGGP